MIKETSEASEANPIDEMYYQISWALGTMLFFYLVSYSPAFVVASFVSSLAMALTAKFKDSSNSFLEHFFFYQETLYTGIFYIPIMFIMRFTWNF